MLFHIFVSMKRLFLALVLDICTESVCAQHHIVVADMDTRLPLTGAIVSTDAGERVVSNHLGRVSLERACRSATVSAKNYMQRRVGVADMARDTILLIPQEVVLDNVDVTAPKLGFDMQKALRSVKENAKLNEQAQKGFDMLGVFSLMFPSKKKSRAEKIKKILERY